MFFLKDNIVNNIVNILIIIVNINNLIFTLTIILIFVEYISIKINKPIDFNLKISNIIYSCYAICGVIMIFFVLGKWMFIEKYYHFHEFFLEEALIPIALLGSKIMGPVVNIEDRKSVV